MSEEFSVGQYDLNGKRISTISGMGRNKNTWDHSFNSRRTAQRHAKECRESKEPWMVNKVYKVEPN